MKFVLKLVIFVVKMEFVFSVVMGKDTMLLLLVKVTDQIVKNAWKIVSIVTMLKLVFYALEEKNLLMELVLKKKISLKMEKSLEKRKDLRQNIGL